MGLVAAIHLAIVALVYLIVTAVFVTTWDGSNKQEKVIPTIITLAKALDKIEGGPIIAQAVVPDQVLEWGTRTCSGNRLLRS